MPKDLTDVAEFTDPIVVPVDTDPRNAASVETPFQALANRTRALLTLPLNNWTDEIQIIASHSSNGVLGLKKLTGSASVDRWVSFGALAGAPHIMTSTYGFTWFNQTFPAGPLTAFTAGIRLTDPAPVATRYLLGSTNGRIIRGTNLSGGGNWALVTSNLEGVGVVEGFAHDPTGDVTIAFSDQIGANTFVRSTDGGATWSAPITSGLANAVISLVWHAPSSEFLAIDSAGALIASADGLVWATKGAGPGINSLNRFASGGGFLVAVQGAGGNVDWARSEDDGATWATGDLEDGDGVFLAFDKRQLIYVERLGLFVLAGGSTQIASTRDGTAGSWLRHVVATTTTSTTWEGVAFGQGRLMMCGDDLSTRCLGFAPELDA